MEKKEFEAIKEKIGSSIQMKLETIRKNLYDHKAACLVGAGFSKNAEMDEDTYMKDWPELGVDFYQSLYGDNFTTDDLKFKSVLRLASQVEASKGRAALETLLQHALPSERVYPGRLHIELMRLPWNDVFTTNYDTLLEKSCVDADRYYYKVTNKETLLYTPHPRIVKLHGSFPDIRPFIITEEDFRTYPQRFPEFVNTVRQSLIENVLCLIGFSGDDPNFLSWIGWIRDVIGKQASPVFQITYDKQLHDSHILLSHDLGIVMVNLAEISGIDGYSMALDFLFTYLSQPYQSQWNGTISNKWNATPTQDEIETLTSKMRMVRTTYPGWYMLPQQHIGEFDDIQREYPFMGCISECPDLSLQALVECLYELDWRIDTICASKNIEWYCKAIDQLPNTLDEEMSKDLFRKILSLKISLLENYRTNLDVDKYLELKEVILGNQKILSYEQKRKFVYEQALFAVSMLNYNEANNLLNAWQLRSMDYLGAIWKSCILTEVGRKREAEILLKETLRVVKQNILSDSYSPALMSARFAIELCIWNLNPMDEERPIVNKDFDYNKVFDSYRNSITKQLVKPEAVQETHGFNILSSGKQWNGGESGFQGDYWGAYGYFKMHEKIGLPLGIVGGWGMEIEAKKSVLMSLVKYEIGYSVSLFIRCASKSLVENVMSRAALKHFDIEFANSLFDQYIDVCKKGLELDCVKDQKMRVVTVLLPILTRLSVKLSSGRNKTLFLQWVEVYQKYPRLFDTTMVWTLFWNTAGENLNDCERIALELPISVDMMVKDMPIPDSYKGYVSLPNETLVSIITALESEKKNIADRGYRRLMRLAECELSDEQKAMLENIVERWRRKVPMNNHMLLSYFKYPPIADNEEAYRSIINKELQAFVEEPFPNDHSSAFVSNFVSALERIQPVYEYMSYEEHCRFIDKVVQFLRDNEDFFKRDDSEDWFGGFHDKISGIFDVLGYYTGIENLPNPDGEKWNELLQELLRYRKYNYPVMASVSHLFFFTKKDKTKLKNMVGEVLLHNKMSLVQDASIAFLYMAKKQRSRVNQSLIKKVISYVTYTFDEKTPIYLEMILFTLIYGGISKEAKTQLINYMDSFPKISYAISDENERKVDIEYYANKLAGAMSVLMPEWTRIAEWRVYIEGMFNDVRYGFEKGVAIAQ